ncbi:hypothetical protein BD31_I0780 [Candidatus Nitrosopumilus salaria BD31]|uniref:Uncharacterized protein n=1 Tax=Candidatus Nitrosopumilus salarius BD31 TaxID=859350 RepID=I3CZV1_9ARCH|nr:hypothetical protein [Candidatus Nitrosopumilus salaria]EIJ64994.1 hypothetical protein BD31_I0780 [Candidatus Nitrosopumilus salaria BD31]
MQNFDKLKFEDFWNQLSKLLLEKHDFETIDQNKKFDARNAIQAVVVTPESTRNKRVIKYDEFIKIWRLARKLPKDQFLKPSSYTNDTQNSSYIVTLLKIILESSSE